MVMKIKKSKKLAKAELRKYEKLITGGLQQIYQGLVIQNEALANAHAISSTTDWLDFLKRMRPEIDKSLETLADFDYDELSEGIMAAICHEKKRFYDLISYDKPLDKKAN